MQVPKQWVNSAQKAPGTKIITAHDKSKMSHFEKSKQ